MSHVRLGVFRLRRVSVRQLSNGTVAVFATVPLTVSYGTNVPQAPSC
jgi:hypothetical protein